MSMKLTRSISEGDRTMPKIKIEITVTTYEAAVYLLSNLNEVLRRGHLEDLKVTVVGEHPEE